MPWAFLTAFSVIIDVLMCASKSVTAFYNTDWSLLSLWLEPSTTSCMESTYLATCIRSSTRLLYRCSWRSLFLFITETKTSLLS